jgi:hypothetical protein
VLQHQVHAAGGSLRAKTPAGAGQHQQAPAGQEKASGPAKQAVFHRSIHCWTGKATGSTQQLQQYSLVMLVIVMAKLG